MRKTSTVVFTEDDRDKGKVFLVTEMAARVAEAWALRFLLALQRGGVEVPEDLAHLGFVGVASAIGSKMIGGLAPSEVGPLLDELMRCVQVMPNPSNPSLTRPLVDAGIEGDDIEEVATRVKLKLEVVALHVGFSSRGELMTWISQRAMLASPTMPTSPGLSAL